MIEEEYGIPTQELEETQEKVLKMLSIKNIIKD
jgi:hypothetical protein